MLSDQHSERQWNVTPSPQRETEGKNPSALPTFPKPILRSSLSLFLSLSPSIYLFILDIFRNPS